MTTDADGYGPQQGQTDLDRLLEETRTLSPLGVERVADGWERHAGGGRHESWVAAERAALHVLEERGKTSEWQQLQNRVLGLTEHEHALVAWREEHGAAGHAAEQALLGASLGLLARPDLDRSHTRVLLAPMAEALPWLDGAVGSG
jgi:hypothetical protein